MDQPIGDWGLASQAHEIEAGYLGNRRGFAGTARPATSRPEGTRPTPPLAITDQRSAR